MTGTFLINNIPATILYDSGASKSFLASTFCSLLNKPPKRLERPFEVQAAIGKTTKVSTFIEDCTITIERYLFSLQLFPITLGGFDVVLGIDWLAANKAHIICDERRVQIQAPDGSWISIYGDYEGSRVRIISMMKAKKLMNQGC